MIIDIEQAKILVEGDKTFYLELTDTFFEEYDALLSDLTRALEESNAELLGRTGHTIKGALANLCAEEARELAFTLERMGKDGNLQGADQLVLDLREAIERFRSHLQMQIVKGQAW